MASKDKKSGSDPEPLAEAHTVPDGQHPDFLDGIVGGGQAGPDAMAADERAFTPVPGGPSASQVAI